jgi:hypothetical protein
MATYTPPRSPAPQGTESAKGTMPRRGTPARETPPRRAPRPGPEDPGNRPYSAPRHTRPLVDPRPKPAKPVRPATRPPARPAYARTRTPRPRYPRAPFILLLVGLLGGALVCLLVISTTLAQGSYRITSLQQQNANLAKQEQSLTNEVAQSSSPAVIAQEAEAFGMRPNPALQFINLKTGKVVKGQVSKADAEINVPGYTP